MSKNYEEKMQEIVSTIAVAKELSKDPWWNKTDNHKAIKDFSTNTTNWIIKSILDATDVKTRQQISV